MCACVSKIRWRSSPGSLFSFWLSTKTHSRSNCPFGVEFAVRIVEPDIYGIQNFESFWKLLLWETHIKKAYVLGPSNFETRINAYQKDKCWNSKSILRNGTCLFRFPHAVWKRQMHTIMFFLVARLIVGFGRAVLGIWIVPSVGLLLAVIHRIQSTNRPLRKGNLGAHDKSRGHVNRAIYRGGSQRVNSPNYCATETLKREYAIKSFKHKCSIYIYKCLIYIYIICRYTYYIYHIQI